MIFKLLLGCLLTVAPKDDWSQKDKEDWDKEKDWDKKDKGGDDKKIVVPGQKNYTVAGMDVLSLTNDG